MFGRRKIAMIVAEFLGTGVLTLLFLSVKTSNIGVPFFVAIAAGLTVSVMMLALAGNSGGYFNPAITLGLWTARKISTLNAILYVAVQLLGAWGAYGLFTYIVNNSVPPATNLHFTGRLLATEAIGTGIFAFGWASALYQGYSRAVTATVAGLSYAIGIIAVSELSIALLNPAVSLGVRSWAWGTYVLGPVVGAVIGVNLYGMLFAEPEKGAASVASKIGSVFSASKATAKKSAAPAKKKAKRAKK